MPRRRRLGDTDRQDRAANDTAIRSGEGRPLSAYRIPTFLHSGDHDDRVWIITDEIEFLDAATTVLFPSGC